MDETGSCYRHIHRRTYVCENVGKLSVHAAKVMKIKYKSTACLCKNADSSERVPIAVIRKSVIPRCLRIGKIFFSILIKEMHGWALSIFGNEFPWCFYGIFIQNISSNRIVYEKL